MITFFTTLFIVLFFMYLTVLLGSLLGTLLTKFKFARGLWILIPFRLGGYIGTDGFVYKQDWIWSDIDFSENPKFRNL